MGRRGWEGLAYVDGGAVGSKAVDVDGVSTRVVTEEVSWGLEGGWGWCCCSSLFGTVSGGRGTGRYVGISQTWCSHGLPVVVPQTAKGVADVGRFGGGLGLVFVGGGLVICASYVEVDLVKRRGQGCGVG